MNEYTYPVSTTRYNRVDVATIDAEARRSGIKAALDGVTLSDVLGIPTLRFAFFSALDATDEQLLFSVVDGHTGIPEVEPSARLTPSGSLTVEVQPRSGSVFETFSVNWADPTTWHADVEEVTGATCTPTGQPDEYQLPGVTWRGVLDVTHGKITQETRLAHKRLRVYVDSVEQPEEEFGWAMYEADPTPGLPNPYEPGTWTADYATGVLTFKSPPTGTVTADYCLPRSSSWYVEPATGRQLVLLAVEVNASVDVVMRDAVVFTPQVTMKYAADIGQLDDEAAALGITAAAMTALGIAGQPGTLLLKSREADAAPFYAGAAAALGITVAQLKAAQGLPLEDFAWTDVTSESREYRRISDFIVESQRTYPLIEKVGGTNARALGQQWFSFRWPYEEAAARMFVEHETRLRVGLKHDIPFRGEYVGVSVYALSQEVT